MKNNTNTNDNLLQGFSFQELIDTISCNEKIINEESATKVFNEILSMQLHDAKFLLQEHMQEIIQLAK